MLRDNLVGLIEPMPISAGVSPLALSIQKQASDDRSSCLENPRPEGAEPSLTENVTSPFQAEPAHTDKRIRRGSFRNVPDLIAAINQYIQAHNQNPKVFIWSASVERILGKIAKCKEALETLH